LKSKQQLGKNTTRKMLEEYQTQFSTLFLALKDKQSIALHVEFMVKQFKRKWGFHLGNCKSISTENLKVKCWDKIPKLGSSRVLLTID